MYKTPVNSKNKQVSFITENSIFVFCGDEFCRLSRDGSIRDALDTVEGPQHDGQWKKFRDAWLVSGQEAGKVVNYLQIIPADRPSGAQGIKTSYVQHVSVIERENNE